MEHDSIDEWVDYLNVDLQELKKYHSQQSDMSIRDYPVEERKKKTPQQNIFVDVNTRKLCS